MTLAPAEAAKSINSVVWTNKTNKDLSVAKCNKAFCETKFCKRKNANSILACGTNSFKMRTAFCMSAKIKSTTILFPHKLNHKENDNA